MQTKYDVGQTVYYERMGGVDVGVIHGISVYTLRPGDDVIVRYSIDGLDLDEDKVDARPTRLFGRLIDRAYQEYRASVERLRGEMLAMAYGKTHG